jgi:hypothetical protein
MVVFLMARSSRSCLSQSPRIQRIDYGGRVLAGLFVWGYVAGSEVDNQVQLQSLALDLPTEKRRMDWNKIDSQDLHSFFTVIRIPHYLPTTCLVSEPVDSYSRESLKMAVMTRMCSHDVVEYGLPCKLDVREEVSV